MPSGTNNNPMDFTMNGDIDTTREDLVAFLKGSGLDYNYDGSNISTLLDVLAHNEFGIFWYLNMALREAHPSAAVLRTSVVAHAKSHNYLPQSATSSSAVVSFTIPSAEANTSQGSFVLPRFTEFRSSVGNLTLLFVTNEDIVVQRNPNGDFVFNTIRIYEGIPVEETFTVGQELERFPISNPDVDVDSLIVKVRQEAGAEEAILWNRYTSAADMKQDTRGYFIYMNRDAHYELQFGDGNTGRSLFSGNIVEISYRSTHGDDGNTAAEFGLVEIQGNDDVNEENINVATDSNSSGGSDIEDTESIKKNTISAQSTQGRMVVESDFRDELPKRFSFLHNLHVFGGQKANPPKFGKIMLVIEHANSNVVSENERRAIIQFCESKMSPVASIEIVEPENIYLDLAYVVDFRLSETPNPETLRSDVVNEIQAFADANINGFNKTFVLSQLTNHITDSSIAVEGAQATALLIREWEDLRVGQTFYYDNSINSRDISSTVYSTPFSYQNHPSSQFADDRKGNIDIIFLDNGQKRFISRRVGSVNYETGVVVLNHLGDIVASQNESIFIYAKPADDSISVTQNRLLRFNRAFVSVRPLGTS